MNRLKEMIYNCSCENCKALVWLLEECNAHIIISEKNCGRMCELAIVAATKDLGINENSVVKERRLYAEHLGVNLGIREISNSNEPKHIKWAISNSNHNPSAKNRINIGKAKASYENGRYKLL